MKILFVLVVSSALMGIIFMLGMRWEAYQIKLSLQQSGSAIARWGDTSRVKIVGTAQDIK